MKHIYLIPLFFLGFLTYVAVLPQTTHAAEVCYLDDTGGATWWGSTCIDPAKGLYGAGYANDNPDTVILRHQDTCGSTHYDYRIKGPTTAWSPWICYEGGDCPSGSIEFNQVGDTYTDPTTGFTFTFARRDRLKDILVENLQQTSNACQVFQVEFFTNGRDCVSNESRPQSKQVNFVSAGCKMGTIASCANSATKVANTNVQILHASGRSEVVQTDSQGNFYNRTTPSVLGGGIAYAIRPQNPSASPYSGAPQSTTTTYSWNSGLASDTPYGSMSYESQATNGCAGPNGSGVTGRCDFCLATPVATVATVATVTPTVTPTPPPVGICASYVDGNSTTTAGNVTIQGIIYDDTNGNCTLDAGETGLNNVTLTLDQTSPSSCTSGHQNMSPDSFLSNGAYSFSNQLDCFGAGSTATYRLETSPNSPGKASCTPQYNTGSISAGNTVTVNIGIIDAQRPWFQAIGGGISAFGDIVSQIAAGFKLINTPDEVAIGGRTINTCECTILTSNWNATVYDNNLYFDFGKKITQLTNDSDVTTGTLSHGPLASDNDPTKPETDVIIYHLTDTRPVLTGNWEDIDEKIIIVADNDIEIGSTLINNHITLGATGYVTIIANGNIYIDSAIGANTNNPSDTTIHIEGLLLAGNNVYDGGGDKRLNISGTVAAGFLQGNGTFIMDRAHDQNSENLQYPSNQVNYNAKLMQNTPGAMSEPKYEWKEIR